MSGFDLNSYETVKQRKQRFYEKHPDGRIVVDIQNEDIDEKAIVRAIVFVTSDDQKNNLPKAVGHALEIRDKELSKNKFGKDYESVNFSSWLENCEESAVGRALDNAGFASNGKCSRDEIEKAQRNTQALSPSQASSGSVTNKAGYVISFGKLAGKTLSEVPDVELASYVGFLKSAATKDGKPISGKAKELINEVELFFKNRTGNIPH